MNIKEKIDVAMQRIIDARNKYDPIEVFGLFSGGHDSFCATYIASLTKKFRGAVHINTGIGVEATHQYVRDTSKSMGWLLSEYYAESNRDSHGELDPQIYDDLVIERGFPGPDHHGKMYDRLKDRCLRCLQRDCGATARTKKPRRVMYISGCRSDESIRRMANTEEVQVDGQRIWVAPIHDWTKLDTSELIERAGAKRNPVVDLIHKSGECLCGAFAQPGELAELSMWPETRPVYERIIALQKKVNNAGFPWGWEEGPPKAYLEEKRGQVFMPEMKQHLCWSCNAKRNLVQPLQDHDQRHPLSTM